MALLRTIIAVECGGQNPSFAEGLPTWSEENRKREIVIAFRPYKAGRAE